MPEPRLPHRQWVAALSGDRLDDFGDKQDRVSGPDHVADLANTEPQSTAVGDGTALCGDHCFTELLHFVPGLAPWPAKKAS